MSQNVLFASQCHAFSNEEVESIRQYSGSSFISINKCLRDKSSDKACQHINNINMIFEKLSPIQFIGVLYRGVFFDGMMNMKEGDTIEDSGFVSTSSLEMIAKGFMKAPKDAPFCCLMEIHFQPDMQYKILRICETSKHQRENEYLLPPGSKFLIKEIKVESGFLAKHTKYIVDYIPPSYKYGGDTKNKKRIFEIAKGIKIKV